MNETVLSGIRATGRLHFGNFLGAVNNFVRFQEEGENTCLYFIADWHTLTTLKDPEELQSNILEIAKDYLAAGLDPNRSRIYAQSSVPEIAELSLYLSMFQPMGELMGLPTLKDLLKKEQVQTLGIISYPVLMAADILGPQASLVPVGEDQVPNIELARSLATRFNNRFGKTFVIPKMMTKMVRIPGLDGGKMGKSDASNAVDINSPIADIRERYLRHGITDPQRKRREDCGDPYNRCESIYPVHEVITAGEKENRAIANQCLTAQIGCRECKNIMVDNLAALIEPFQEKRRELSSDDDYVRDVLNEGGKAVRKLVQQTVKTVREKVGITIY